MKFQLSATNSWEASRHYVTRVPGPDRAIDKRVQIRQKLALFATVSYGVARCTRDIAHPAPGETDPRRHWKTGGLPAKSGYKVWDLQNLSTINTTRSRDKVREEHKGS